MIIITSILFMYFDNDSGWFASPHPNALNPRKSQEIVHVIERVLVEAME